MLKKVIDFINEYFFYRVSKEEKENIRNSVALEDHRSYLNILIIIFVLQCIMLIHSVISYGIFVEDKTIIYYRLLSISLSLLCVVASYLTRFFYRKKKSFLFFCVVNTMVDALLLWCSGITILESYDGIDLTTYAYISMSIPLVVVIEPWITSIDFIAVTLILNLFLALNPETSSFYNYKVIINSVSIVIIVMFGATFLFHRRIKRLKTDIKVEELNNQLKQRAIIDDLTKLFNRSYLTERLNNPLIVDSKHAGIMMIDIDHFKNINDIYGHRSGDEVLAEIGKIIIDYMASDGYAVRYGGEEFLLYYSDINAEELLIKGEELRKKFADCTVITQDNMKINFTVSIGLAMSTNNINYSGLISFADKALYKAKESRNSVSIKE